MEYRVENKYLVTDADLALLAARLRTIMEQDAHQDGDFYEIRSLYFDDLLDSCMDENESGIDQRQKYRIRIYDPEASLIRLEIKEKQNGLTKKMSCPLTQEDYNQISDGKLSLVPDGRRPLDLLRMQIRCAGMRPKVIIAYERTAYVHPTGNVRITFDRNIMASKACDAFFHTQVRSMVPVLPTGMHVLEVKYDEFLPDSIAKQLEIGRLHQTAFSKYYLGRLAVQGSFPVNR